MEEPWIASHLTNLRGSVQPVAMQKERVHQTEIFLNKRENEIASLGRMEKFPTENVG